MFDVHAALARDAKHEHADLTVGAKHEQGHEEPVLGVVAPENVMPKIGTIEKIRIQFSKPNEEGDGEVEEEEEAPPRFSDRW